MNASNFARYSVALSVVPAVYFSIFPGRIVLATAFCLYPLLLLLPLLQAKTNAKKIDAALYIRLFYGFNIIVFATGFLNAETSGDWGSLLSGGAALGLFIPFTIYFGALTP